MQKSRAEKELGGGKGKPRRNGSIRIFTKNGGAEEGKCRVTPNEGGGEGGARGANFGGGGVG